MSEPIDWDEVNAAVELLRRGDYSRGWPALEAVRFGLGYFRSRKPSLSFPEWGGEPITSLAVLGEQGLGDQIQFARFIPELVRRGVNVTLYAYPAVAPLFAGLGAKVIAADGQMRIERADAWAMIASLPLRLDVRLETLSGAPYLDVPAGRKALQSGRVGVVHRGGPNNINDAQRSMSRADAAPLMTLPGAISLLPEDTGAADMGDGAAIIAGLDAVVTVDTSLAHLAGAMGKRTLLMLPAVGADWRWLDGRADSPWYDSVEIFRQRVPGDWAEVIERAQAALAE